METSRGKKGKKAGWHITLGPKEAIFVGIGVVGLMMMSFALGALAGRGEIYRAASSWGLLTPEASPVAQWTPTPAAIPATAPAPVGIASAPSPPPATAASPVSPTPPAVAAKPEPAAPVTTGSIAPLPSPVATATKKKAKAGTSARNPKSHEEEMRRVRQEVVSKLKFQNSFDTGPKPRVPKGKDREKLQGKAAPPTQVRVGQYRTSKEAQAKVAELQKKGVKASLKTIKDAKGTFYIVYKGTGPGQPNAAKLAQKPVKSSATTRKPKPE